MRWMVTGAGGALGTDVVRVLSRDPADELTALPRERLDITDREAVRAAVRSWVAGGRTGRSGDPGPVLVNAAAFTAVDRAEVEAAAGAAAEAVNADAPGHLALACAEVGARLVHISTDYVFAGADDRAHEPDDPTAPASVYGRTKLAGEQRVREVLPEGHHVVRTAWVYGDVGTNFVRTMARLAAERDTVDVVDDQHGSPTWSADLAAGVVELGRHEVPAGTLHATGGGATTWFEFARAVFVELGADPERVRPCPTDRFPRPAPRPANSVLSDASWRATGLAPLPAWRGALSAAVRRHPELLHSVQR